MNANGEEEKSKEKVLHAGESLDDLGDNCLVSWSGPRNMLATTCVTGQYEVGRKWKAIHQVSMWPGFIGAITHVMDMNIGTRIYYSYCKGFR